MFLRYYDTRLDPLCQAFFFCRPRLPPRLAPATANVFLLSETPFICLTHFRKRENTFAFVSAPAIAQPVYLRRAQGEAEVPTNVAQAIVQPVYLRHTQGEAEVPTNVAPAIAQLVYLRQERRDGETAFTRTSATSEPYHLVGGTIRSPTHFRHAEMILLFE